jgi:iron complex outermembrane receptor protein
MITISAPTLTAQRDGNENMNGIKKVSMFGSIAVLLGLSMGPQLVRADSSDPSKQVATLGEIVVTAEKREERLQDVPVPVSVISAAALADSNQVRLQDYYTQVPSLNLTQGIQSFQNPILRGLLTTTLIDDAPISSVVPDIDPSSLARIEVLRGPQGTLYGSSGLGGVVKFVTVDPSSDSVSGRVEAGTNSVYNGYGLGYNFRGSVNVPLTSDLAIRASAFWRQDAGYIDNPVRHVEGVNEDHANGGQLTALWRPSEFFSLRLSALYQDIKGGNGYAQTTNGLTLQPLGDLQQADVAGTGPYERKTAAYSAVLKANLNGINLTSVTGYNTSSAVDYLDASPFYASEVLSLFGVIGEPELNVHKATSVTQEIRLSGSLGQKFDWVLGGYYNHQANPFIQYLLATNPTTGAIAGSFGTLSFPAPSTEYAGFADLTYHFNDRFDIQIGGRESQIKQEFYTDFTGPFVPYAGLGPSPYNPPTLQASSRPFTYLLTPRFRFSPDLMVYVRLASAFLPGGPNQPGPGVPPQQGPEKTENYELGVKGDFLDHVLSLDASLYYIDFTDIQVGYQNPVTNLTYGINGGEAKSQGVELTAELRPTSGLKVSAWMVYADAKITSVAAGVISPIYVGERLPDYSRFSGNLSVDQEFHLTSVTTGFVGATENYIGDREGPFALGQRLIVPAYAKTDLRAGVKHDSWTANLYVNNLTNRRGLISGDNQNTFPNYRFYITPRTIGLSLARTF